VRKGGAGTASEREGERGSERKRERGRERFPLGSGAEREKERGGKRNVPSWLGSGSRGLASRSPTPRSTLPPSAESHTTRESNENKSGHNVYYTA